MKRILVSLLTALALIAQPALATTRKPVVIVSGQLKAIPTGDTLILNPTATGGASINIPHGTAPTSPNNGDCWTTTAGMFCRINGSTVGPFGAGGGGAPADGDYGDIVVSGTGTSWLIDSAASPEVTGLNIGHASDTTLTRSGAGDLAVEGNGLYRAGGTDVPVTDGGTGASTASAARINLLPSFTGNALKVLRVNAGETDVEFATIGALTDGDKGDITVGSGGTDWQIDANAVGTTEIANSAVTLAKIANAAANAKLVGSGAAGSGSAYAEITLGTNLSMSGTTINAASVSTPSGTSFPGSPSTDDLFYRTDRRIEYFYDGTRWLSTQLFTVEFAQQGAVHPQTASSAYRSINPGWNTYDIYALTLTAALYSTSTTATNYFTLQMRRSDGASDTNVGSSISGQNDTQNAWAGHSTAINTVISSTNEVLDVLYTETGTSTTYMAVMLTYRLVG